MSSLLLFGALAVAGGEPKEKRLVFEDTELVCEMWSADTRVLVAPASAGAAASEVARRAALVEGLEFGVSYNIEKMEARCREGLQIEGSTWLEDALRYCVAEAMGREASEPDEHLAAMRAMTEVDGPLAERARLHMALQWWQRVDKIKPGHARGPEALEALASELGVEPVALMGQVATTGVALGRGSELVAYTTRLQDLDPERAIDWATLELDVRANQPFPDESAIQALRARLPDYRSPEARGVKTPRLSIEADITRAWGDVTSCAETHGWPSGVHRIWVHFDDEKKARAEADTPLGQCAAEKVAPFEPQVEGWAEFAIVVVASER